MSLRLSSSPISSTFHFPLPIDLYRGESRGLAEEMHDIAAMHLCPHLLEDVEEEEERWKSWVSTEVVVDSKWEPSMNGFLKYLVDSLTVFSTLERIVQDSDNVAYACLRETGLERTERLLMDLDWLRQQGFIIPESGIPGTTYAKYLKKISKSSAPSFLCHFYCIYFAHITKGRVISNQVSQFLLGKELLFNQWDGNPNDSLRSVEDILNVLGEHSYPDVKNKFLMEAAKSFQMYEEIVLLIFS